MIEQQQQQHSSSSSDEEDGDEQWKAAIKAAASTYLGCSQPNQTSTPSIVEHDDDAKALQPQPLKHYQIKAQKALDDLLAKSLVMVQNSDSIDELDDDPVANEGGVRLFKQAPVGIVFDRRDEFKGPKKKPRIIPGEKIDEKSKKFRRRLQSVVVEGTDVLTNAKHACQKSLSKLEAKEAAARDAAKKEEKRVAELKKIRGERWLPSIAREMQVKSQVR